MTARLPISNILCAFFAAFLVVGAAGRPALAKSAASLNNDGVKLYQDEDYEGALKKFKEAQKADGENPDILINIGHAQEAMGELDDAVASYKEAIALDPENLDAHNNLGVAYFQQNELSKAEAEWKFVLTLDPNHEEATGNLELLASGGGAKGASVEGITADNLDEAFRAGKTAYATRNFEDAAAIFGKILEIKPNSKFSNYYRGVAAYRLGDEAAAAEYLREYLILESAPPENKDVYEFAKAVFAKVTGIELKKGKSSYDVRAAALFDKGKASYKAGDYFEAIQSLNNALVFKSDSYYTNYYLGMAYIAIKDYNRAAYHLSKCLVSKSKENTKELRQKVEQLLKSIT